VETGTYNECVRDMRTWKLLVDLREIRPRPSKQDGR
jgi:hypothetical protein